MANKQTTAKVKHKDGNELTVQQNETDCPIIPVVQLERLQSFKPEAVDFVINQTQIEAEHRRLETKRVNTFIFAQNLIGQSCALVIGLTGIVGGCYVAFKGQPTAGATIATVALTGLAAVYLTGRHK